MNCNLPTYGKCRVMVEYARDEQERPVNTIIELFDKNGNLISQGESWCHPNDSCRKDMGRKYALLDLFSQAEKNNIPLFKNDKKKLFQLVCPKFPNKE